MDTTNTALKHDHRDVVVVHTLCSELLICIELYQSTILKIKTFSLFILAKCAVNTRKTILLIRQLDSTFPIENKMITTAFFLLSPSLKPRLFQTLSFLSQNSKVALKLASLLGITAAN